MRLLVVVQRYGEEVFGGAESACRALAEQLVGRGHRVEVVTSNAVRHDDWAPELAVGRTEVAGVTVHRLPVVGRRDPAFGRHNDRVARSPLEVTPTAQRAWLDAQGPLLGGLDRALAEGARRADVAVFFTYLYHPTWWGLPAVSGVRPTVLHPAAHDEPAFRLPLFDRLFQHATGLAYFTPEERALVANRFALERPEAVVGSGIEVPPAGTDPARFRRAFGLGERPYLLVLNRADPAKATDELVRYVETYKRRRGGALALVVMGDAAGVPGDGSSDVVVTGFVSEQDKADAMAGAVALVQPSYLESFSLVAAEAWTHATPTLVQGATDVLAGQVARAGGGLAYRGYLEFEVAVDLLTESPGLARRLGEAGRRYVEVTYSWDAVVARYEALLDRVAAAWRPPR